MDTDSLPLSSCRGFSLVEVLVAMALVAVVGASALLLLRSVHEGTGEIGRQEPRTVLDDGLETFRQDLLHLTAPWTYAGQKKPPALRLQDNTLSFLRDQAGLLTAIEYRREKETVLRVVTGLTGAETNVWMDAVSSWSVSVTSDETGYDVWPAENEKELPRLLSLDVTRGQGETRSLKVPIPAGLVVTNDNSRVEQP